MTILACDIGDVELEYNMFQKACGIDLSNDDPHPSDAGIHAASYGGLWQCVVCGFGGLRMLDGKLRIEPKLPKAWNGLKHTFCWKGQKIQVSVDREGIQVENETGTDDPEIEIRGELYLVKGVLKI